MQNQFNLCFDTIRACNRQTHRHTMTASTASRGQQQSLSLFIATSTSLMCYISTRTGNVTTSTLTAFNCIRCTSAPIGPTPCDCKVPCNLFGVTVDCLCFSPARCGYASAGISCRRGYVCLSVTCRYCIETAARIELLFAHEFLQK